MRITVMTDASFCPETGAAGYGYWIASERGKRGGGGAMRDPVANSTAAEMMAICNALAIGMSHSLIMSDDHILVQTDSVTAITLFENHRVSRIPEEKETVKHFHNFRREKQIKISFRHVKGHAKKQNARSIANHMCDKRAREGMYRARARLKEKVDAQ